MTTLPNLIIVSGARQGIGKAFLEYYKSRQDAVCLGLSKTSNQQFLQIDLVDEVAVGKAVEELNLEGIERILFLHAVGMDKFEPKGVPQIDNDGDGIDDVVYNTNVSSFIPLATSLIEKATALKIPLLLGNVGSISDIYAVPFWQSFSKAKNRLRQFLKSVNNHFVQGIFLNVGSTLDQEGRYKWGRINADTTYWQTCEELVQKATPYIDDFLFRQPHTNFAEFDFYKHNPYFRSDYFTNLPKLYFTWQRDLGLEGKEVPPGIRI